MDLDQSLPLQERPKPTIVNPVANVPTKTKVTFPERKKEKSSKKILIPIILILILAAGGFFILFKDKLPFLSSEEPTPTPFEPEQLLTFSPTPIPKPAIDRDEIKIEVLNGTGISGEAAFLQNELGDLGYSDIDIGNTSNQNSKTTQVTFDENVSDEVQDEILNLLNDLYVDVEDSTDTLTTEDVQIITGLRPGQDFPPTSTPTPQITETSTPTTTITGTSTSSPTETLTPTPTP